MLFAAVRFSGTSGPIVRVRNRTTRSARFRPTRRTKRVRPRSTAAIVR